MKSLIYFVAIVLTVSCTAYKREHFYYRSSQAMKPNDIKKNNQFYIDNFKDMVFCNCLFEGYDNKLGDTIFRLMAKKDLFALTDDVDLRRDSLVDKLSKNVIRNIPPPRVHIESDITGRNFIISSCLRYFESRELDSIARKFYKEKDIEEKKLYEKF